MSGAETGIASIARYTRRMRRSLIDKLYFADKVDASLIVDYGCADGSMLVGLRARLPEQRCIGYDTAAEMIGRSRGQGSGIRFTTDWATIHDEVQASPGRSALVLSSVIHEVYSYEDRPGIERFWERVWETGFDFVAIRDMVPGAQMNRPSDPECVARVRRVARPVHLRQWEREWGTLAGQRSLVHYLLTCPYTDNWDRELKENYFPVQLDELLALVPPRYKATYMDHYTLPHVRTRVREEFGIEVRDATHLKLVLERSTGGGSRQ